MSEYIALGEIMLRLKSPESERFLQLPHFEASFGGAEANVAVSLANFGLESALVTALPDNMIAERCLRELRGYGVDTQHIVLGGERLGIYYLEQGSNQRPGRVIYDRAGSSFAQAQATDFDWDRIFEGAVWFHTSGITPALSATAAEMTIEAMKQARKRGVKVCCDFNYRSKLWQYGKSAKEVMTEIVSLVDVAIAGGNDCYEALGIDVEGTRDGTDAQRTAYFDALTAKMMATFPNLKIMAMTMRQSISANHHRWAACLRYSRGFHISRNYEITDIVDRVGTGDSFTAGLLAGLKFYKKEQDVLNFAVAASCLKHSIKGDFNQVTRSEVEELMSSNGSGQVQR